VVVVALGIVAVMIAVWVQLGGIEFEAFESVFEGLVTVIADYGDLCGKKSLFEDREAVYG
jgi:hypothetical protein